MSNPTILFAIIRWVATILGSTTIGVWLSTYITPEVIESIYSAGAAIVGGVIAIVAIVQSILEKNKAAKEASKK